MTMLEHIKRLFVYDDWANREGLTALQALPAPPARSLNLLVQKQTVAVWPLFTIEQCKLEVDQLPGLWQSYLTSLGEAGLSRSLAYKNTKGESFTSQKQDVLLHVVMHSAYHRGQIAADMRAAGFTPASTDLVHAV